MTGLDPHYGKQEGNSSIFKFFISSSYKKKKKKIEDSSTSQLCINFTSSHQIKEMVYQAVDFCSTVLALSKYSM